MSPIAQAIDLQVAELAVMTARHGRQVDVEGLGILDRSGQLALSRPGIVSPNGACRLFQAADGWMVVNLARDEDRDLIPAWFHCDTEAHPWTVIAAHAGSHTRADLIAQAVLLGLPAAAVGEVRADDLDAPLLTHGAGVTGRADLNVVDLSALWAGPMCGAILAAMGAKVLKIESTRRPDATRVSTPEFFHRLNGAKRCIGLDLGSEDGRAALREAISTADVMITSARPRAFAGLGLDPDLIFGLNPGLVWVAITGYGWTGDAALRVAFGDDAAAAGGLVRWTPSGAPRFLGDALADPVTGLAAALGALRGLEAGGGVVVDLSLARSAAGVATVCQLRRRQ